MDSKQMEAEERLFSIRQDGWALEQYVEDFIEHVHFVPWSDGTFKDSSGLDWMIIFSVSPPSSPESPSSPLVPPSPSSSPESPSSPPVPASPAPPERPPDSLRVFKDLKLNISVAIVAGPRCQGHGACSTVASRAH
ncbi:hypothetical protein G5714_010304 [Onychostoma macrolepis]|uniref:Uncharacterized protein n=1 Tax=Onychostoma macrolepis TaxID=369639 RepID=A0A7J6CQ37_9TELE|nr:hypothetical protein G5714_010304 [Onychostoma macrolepis]